jgi:pyruvate/2-oxoglutarate dehydrogenase complex dihydrolipoamide acyltransferase (E2) component
MSATIIMPQLGETVAEGKILTWFKVVGDEIHEGDNLFEVETDKVTIDVQAIVSGRLSEIRVSAGTVARVGDVVAIVGGLVEVVGARSASNNVTSQSQDGTLFEEVATPLTNFGPAKGPNGIRITPLARRLIAQTGLDLDLLARDAEQRGNARIIEADVKSAISRGLAASRAPRAGAKHIQATEPNEQIIALNSVRLRTGERLAENWRNIPHVFQAVEVDFTVIDRIRKGQKNAFQKAHGFPLTYLPFIARATCLAMQAFPLVNARFDGRTLTLSREAHLGIAVDLSHNGLVVPIVRAAGDLSFVGLAKAIRRQIDKARSGNLTPDDLAGGTYSISNNGAFGTLFTAPIINAPQVAILSTDAIRLKPAVLSTSEGSFVAARMMGMVGQSFDHRAFDGAYSAAFLSRLKQLLEERNWAEELDAPK